MRPSREVSQNIIHLSLTSENIEMARATPDVVQSEHADSVHSLQKTTRNQNEKQKLELSKKASESEESKHSNLSSESEKSDSEPGNPRLTTH